MLSVSHSLVWANCSACGRECTYIICRPIAPTKHNYYNVYDRIVSRRHHHSCVNCDVCGRPSAKQTDHTHAQCAVLSAAFKFTFKFNNTRDCCVNRTTRGGGDKLSNDDCVTNVEFTRALSAYKATDKTTLVWPCKHAFSRATWLLCKLATWEVVGVETIRPGGPAVRSTATTYFGYSICILLRPILLFSATINEA